VNLLSEVKAIKVSKETYAKLSEIAGELQVKLRRPVSIEEAMKDLIKRKEKGRKISDLAGSWKITEAEFAEIKSSINESWQKWNPEQ
jgi:predicted  nucleic acid-binding Zn-ribbon protein